MSVMRSLLLKGSQNSWLATRVAGRAFARRAVRRFMPGETAEAALAAAEELKRTDISSVLTLLGEAITERGQAEQVTTHYLDVLDRVRRAALSTHISVKPTQLGLDIGRDLCAEQLAKLVRHAHTTGGFVWVDMEASAYVDATLEVFRHLRSEHSNVGVCLQSYLYRTADDLEELLPLKPAIRLVKGAYDEPPDLAFPCKSDVDANLVRLAKRLLSVNAEGNGTLMGLGTHDTHLIARVQDYAEGAGIPKTAYEIQMLYGIRRSEQARLAAEGYAVRVLISYGTAWFPWYMRRLAERPANLGFVMRSMLRG